MKISPIFSRGDLSKALPIIVLSILAQLVGIITHSVIAKQFGAGGEIDAYTAAMSPAQYISSVLFNPITYLFLPIYINYLSKFNLEDVEELVSGVIFIFLSAVALMVVLGIVFADEILGLVTPGLSPTSADLSHKLSLIIWPALIGSLLINVQTSICQAKQRFILQGLSVVIGAVANLAIITFSIKNLGVFGIAFGYVASIFVQVALLWLVMPSLKIQFPSSFLKNKGVQAFFVGLLPFILLNVFSRLIPMVERHYASELQAGSLSYLNYSSKLFLGFTILVSTGIPTIAFPKMANNYFGDDKSDFSRSFFSSLRYMWLLIAPLIAFGLIFSLPFVKFIFEKGKFSPQDSLIVSNLLQIYLFSLVGMGLGNITNKVFYIFGYTRLVAIAGVVESALYVSLTAFLFKLYGLMGIALSYVFYFNLSLVWQFLFFRFKLGIRIDAKFASHFLQIGCWAAIAAIVTKLSTSFLSGHFLPLLIGAPIGAGLYLGGLILTGKINNPLRSLKE